MNTPSPAPQRRRRPQIQHPPVVPSEARFEVPFEAPRHDVPLQKLPPERPANGAVRSRRKKSRSRAVQLPAFVRVILLMLFAAVFLTCAVAVTRTYLAHMEERRRLEAEAAERAQHPLVYADYIVQYSTVQNLDPALVAAVILCESSYNPTAESWLGARGLMQLMEDTAGWVAHKLSEDDASYSFDLLYDPETNIRFGTWYLGYLSRRFGGDAKKIVCAYHAGQGNVDAWLKNPLYSSDGVTLDVIPTDDTSAYAARVLRARDVYRKYYFPVASQSPAP